MQKTLTSGFPIATAAAALFSMGASLSTSVQAADEMAVHCVGINSCRGQGWVSKNSAAECTAAGGTVGK